MGRLLLVVMLVLGAIYIKQHDTRIQRWWRSYTQPATTSSRVLVYSAPACDICDQAAEMLENAGVPVELVDISENDAARAEVAAGRGALPVIADGNRRMRGYDPQFLSDWYVERPRNRQRLEDLGIYRAGEARIPVLYGTDWCPYCAKARQYFHGNGIRFRDLDIERDAEADRQYKALGHNGVPVIVYDDMVLSGFDARDMDRRREWIGDGQ
ncbi:MAG: Glutaredoxin protein [Moraxellaceae bacterium]|jgi:glutaredoxin|nr:Glutaredoxin protein [Moraxellaceae bacterium]